MSHKRTNESARTGLEDAYVILLLIYERILTPIRDEVRGHVYNCEWFQVYDIIEAIWAHFHKQDEQSFEEEKAPTFEKELNDFFVRRGIGWQLVDGLIVTRGAEAFERAVRTARATLEAGKRPTARTHIDESLGALSRRPSPNLPGAIYHAMGCLECVARDIAGDKKATLGDILKKHPGLLPRPLDKAIEQMWGSCFERGAACGGRSTAKARGSRTSGRYGRDDGDISEQKNRQSDVNGSGTCLQTSFD